MYIKTCKAPRKVIDLQRILRYHGFCPETFTIEQIYVKQLYIETIEIKDKSIIPTRDKKT